MCDLASFVGRVRRSVTELLDGTTPSRSLFLMDEEAAAEAYGHQFKDYFPQRIVILGHGVSWSVLVYEEDPHLLTYFMYVLASRQPVTEIPHTNIHSCLGKVGFRTTSVASTPTSATHSPEVTVNLTQEIARAASLGLHCFHSCRSFCA